MELETRLNKTASLLAQVVDTSQAEMDPALLLNAYDDLQPKETIRKDNLVDYFLDMITDLTSTTILDVGCFNGENFTSEFADKLPQTRVIGVDIFRPEQFNIDSAVKRNDFKTSTEIKDYLLEEIYPDLDNLEFYSLHVKQHTNLMRLFFAGGAQKILTGFKTPGNLSTILIRNAAGRAYPASDNEYDLFINVPTNFPEVVDGSMDRPAYEFPMSDYLNNNILFSREQMGNMLDNGYKLVKKKGVFKPLSYTDLVAYKLSELGKLFIMLDRAKYLEERGMEVAVTKYEDDFGLGPNSPSHLLYAVPK